MRAVVLSVDPADGNPRLWREGLRAAGVAAEVLGSNPPQLPPADLVVTHVLLAAGAAPHPVWEAALRYEAAGVPVTNATACLARCADKWATHAAWAAAGLPQPRTWLLDQADAWSAPLLVKPRWGESARGIRLVRSRAEAVAAAGPWADTALVQEVVPCRSVLRIHATDERVLGAHARPAAAIPGLAEPDPTERPVPITEALEDVAVRAVRAVGGGLVGLDLIETAAGPVLLEANPTFLMPAHLPDLMARILTAALASR